MCSSDLFPSNDIRGANDWDSHLPAIYLVLLKDKETHPLAEFGSGHSTQIINEYCRGHRKFESYENDKEWCVIPSKYVDDYSNNSNSFLLLTNSTNVL